MSYVRSTILLLLATIAVASVADAKSKSVACNPSWVEAAPMRVLQSGISLSQAVAMMQAKYGAKSMRASTIEAGGRVIYEIRLRSADGSRVWTVQVDAASGREL